MATSWQSDKRWSDRFIPELVDIVRQNLPVQIIRPGTFQEDAMEASDLVVLRFDSLRVACRVRRAEYVNRYMDEFTVRAGRPSGTPTELAKVMSGWGGLFIYAFAAPEGQNLTCWHLIDLSELRLSIHRTPDLLTDKYKQKNTDGSSWFYAWPYTAFPPSLIVAKKRAQEVKATYTTQNKSTDSPVKVEPVLP